MTHLTLFDPEHIEAIRQQRDVAMATVQVNAGHEFSAKAREFVISYLRANGPTPGELITNACKEARIVPASGDDRSFGPIYMSLSRKKVIEKAGTCIRTKGHLTAGGNIWKLA